MSVPLIFCHYGANPYLRYVLECAKLSNPDKTVFLLGDGRNEHIARQCGVEFRSFDDFDYGDRVETFNRVYQLIQGKEHGHFKGGRDWVNFVFKRWFFIFNFIKQEKLGSFWHFDSDNMILDRLSLHEEKFKGYDCTEQCQGICMNGYISGPDVVGGYLDKINEVFQRDEYLKTIQKDFDSLHPKFAFTEMAAYSIYKTEERVRSIRLNTVIDGTSFDDAIVLEDGMVMEQLGYGKKVKKVFLCSDGRFFCCEQSGQRLIRMNSLNLSYVPVYLFKQVLAHQQRCRLAGSIKSQPDIRKMKTLAFLAVPISVTLRIRLKKILQTLGLIPRWS